MFFLLWSMKPKPMKAKATKAANKSRKAGSPPKAMTAMKAKARKSVKARSTPQIIKKVMKTKALQKTDTMTKIVGKGDQELWSKVSVKTSLRFGWSPSATRTRSGMTSTGC